MFKKSDFVKAVIALIFLVAALLISYRMGAYSVNTRLEPTVKSLNADLESSRKKSSELESKLIQTEKELAKKTAECEAYRSTLESLKKEGDAK